MTKKKPAKVGLRSAIRWTTGVLLVLGLALTAAVSWFVYDTLGRISQTAQDGAAAARADGVNETLLQRTLERDAARQAAPTASGSPANPFMTAPPPAPAPVPTAPTPQP